MTDWTRPRPCQRQSMSIVFRSFGEEFNQSKRNFRFPESIFVPRWMPCTHCDRWRLQDECGECGKCVYVRIRTHDAKASRLLQNSDKSSWSSRVEREEAGSSSPKFHFLSHTRYLDAAAAAGPRDWAQIRSPMLQRCHPWPLSSLSRPVATLNWPVPRKSSICPAKTAILSYYLCMYKTSTLVCFVDFGLQSSSTAASCGCKSLQTWPGQKKRPLQLSQSVAARHAIKQPWTLNVTHFFFNCKLSSWQYRYIALAFSQFFQALRGWQLNSRERSLDLAWKKHIIDTFDMMKPTRPCLNQGHVFAVDRQSKWRRFLPAKQS